uniref:Transmembrane protein n=1 Tax=Knipowitschia caucasica TaxID=637954 RepID=A0AAV2MKJ7_KNICA
MDVAGWAWWAGFDPGGYRRSGGAAGGACDEIGGWCAGASGLSHLLPDCGGVVHGSVPTPSVGLVLRLLGSVFVLLFLGLFLNARDDWAFVRAEECSAASAEVQRRLGSGGIDVGGGVGADD